MEAPTGKVCYNSRQQLNCTSIEVMSKCVWQMSRGNEDPMILGPGSEIQLSDTCTELSTVTLLKTNGYWSGVLNAIIWIKQDSIYHVVLIYNFLDIPGIYSCLFVTGNIAHMGIAPIQIALLPEVINVTSNPQTADCSGPSPNKVSISCSIENSTETYKVMLKLGSVEIAPIKEGKAIIIL